jgi:hypothetical protein
MSFVRKITTDGFNYNVLHNERNGQLLLRHDGRLCCINLDGHVIYRYDISGNLGLPMDQQGHVYIGGADDIHRLSPDGTFRDIVKLYGSLIWKSNYCFICTWYYSNTLR